MYGCGLMASPAAETTMPVPASSSRGAWLARVGALMQAAQIAGFMGMLMSINRRMAEAPADLTDLANQEGRAGVQMAAMEHAVQYMFAGIGVAVLGLANSHHIGRIGAWAEQCLAAGLVSIHFVNVISEPIVAPFGGSDGRFVTNPMCVGIPMGAGAPLGASPERFAPPGAGWGGAREPVI